MNPLPSVKNILEKRWKINPEPVQPPLILLVSMELGKQKDRYRISIETKADNPLMTVENFNRQFQIGEREKEAVEWGWEQEMGKTTLHLANA